MENFVLSFIASLIASIFVLVVERQRYPDLLIEMDNTANTVPFYSQERGRWKFVRAKISNRTMPFFLKWLIRQTAENCRSTLSFFNEAGEQLFVMRGRWSSTPEIPHFSPTDQVVKVLYPDPITIASGKEEVLDVIAMKAGDKEAYGWNNEAYFNNWKTPVYKLSKGKYKVKIEVATQNGLAFSKMGTLAVGDDIETTFFEK